MSTQDYIALGMLVFNMVFAVYHLARTKQLSLKNFEKALSTNRAAIAQILTDIVSKFAASPTIGVGTENPAGMSNPAESKPVSQVTP